jgi:hypothetical protein
LFPEVLHLFGSLTYSAYGVVYLVCCDETGGTFGFHVISLLSLQTMGFFTRQKRQTLKFHPNRRFECLTLSVYMPPTRQEALKIYADLIGNSF